MLKGLLTAVAKLIKRASILVLAAKPVLTTGISLLCRTRVEPARAKHSIVGDGAGVGVGVALGVGVGEGVGVALGVGVGEGVGVEVGVAVGVGNGFG